MKIIIKNIEKNLRTVTIIIEKKTRSLEIITMKRKKVDISVNNNNNKKKRKVVDSVNNKRNRTLIIGISSFSKTYLMNYILHQKQEPFF